jgi:hypothetical protein
VPAPAPVGGYGAPEQPQQQQQVFLWCTPFYCINKQSL